MEGTTANLKIGDEYLAIDLLYGLLLPSGNDAGIALAQYFGKFLSFAFVHENPKSLKDSEETLESFKVQTNFYDQ